MTYVTTEPFPAHLLPTVASSTQKCTGSLSHFRTGVYGRNINLQSYSYREIDMGQNLYPFFRMGLFADNVYLLYMVWMNTERERPH